MPPTHLPKLSEIANTHTFKYVIYMAYKEHFTFKSG